MRSAGLPHSSRRAYYFIYYGARRHCEADSDFSDASEPSRVNRRKINYSYRRDAVSIIPPEEATEAYLLMRSGQPDLHIFIFFRFGIFFSHYGEKK